MVLSISSLMAITMTKALMPEEELQDAFKEVEQLSPLKSFSKKRSGRIPISMTSF